MGTVWQALPALRTGEWVPCIGPGGPVLGLMIAVSSMQCSTVPGTLVADSVYSRVYWPGARSAWPALHRTVARWGVVQGREYAGAY